MSGPVLRRRRAHPAEEDPPEDEDVENPGQRRSLAAPGGRTDEDKSDGDDGRRPLVVVGELASIVVGIAIIGMSCVSLVVLLDYRGVVRLESARSLRRAVNRLLSDPATLASIEDAVGLKLLDREEHILMKNELWGLTYQGKNLADKLRQMEEAEAKIRELADAGVPGEYERLASRLELGRYCDGCLREEIPRWTCSQRADEEAGTDGAGRVAAKLRIMAEEAALFEREEPGATCSFPPGCRWDCYAENYPGLHLGSEQKALGHWIDWGAFKERRNCKCEGEHHGRREAEVAAKVKETEAAESTAKELTDAKAPEDKESASRTELGRYCDGCEWKDGKTCKERAHEKAKADGTGRVAATLKVMEEEAALWEKKEAGATCSFPPGCRWDCYLANHPGLKKALDSEQKALHHWIAWGAFEEGRNCKCKGS